MNCGTCGDRVDPAVPHECWVYAKIQEQETVHERCIVCGEPIVDYHWRCKA